MIRPFPEYTYTRVSSSLTQPVRGLASSKASDRSERSPAAVRLLAPGVWLVELAARRLGRGWWGPSGSLWRNEFRRAGRSYGTCRPGCLRWPPGRVAPPAGAGSPGPPVRRRACPAVCRTTGTAASGTSPHRRMVLRTPCRTRCTVIGYRAFCGRLVDHALWRAVGGIMQVILVKLIMMLLGPGC